MTLVINTPNTDFPVPTGIFAQVVTSVEHFTDQLFKFRISRPDSFRFRSGEFVMIGLPNAEKPVFRAYSIASPSWDEEIEFYSIKVEDGPLTEYLQKIKVGDTVLMRKKPTGTLVNDALLPGKRLWMFSTGTGIPLFTSLIRDPDTDEKFDQVILTHMPQSRRTDLWSATGRRSEKRPPVRRVCPRLAALLHHDPGRLSVSMTDHRSNGVGQSVH